MADAASFLSIHRHGFVRVAVCTPRVSPADPAFNAEETLRLAGTGHAQGVDLMLFPELGLSAYAIDDLLLRVGRNRSSFVFNGNIGFDGPHC